MEMEFYKKIGVLQWKKFVLWLMSKRIRNPEKRKGGNYYLERIDLNSVRDFKGTLWYNGVIHAFGAICGIIAIIDIIGWIRINNIFSIVMLIINIIFFIVNLYCVMLQRYNWLRIKKVLNKVAHK